MPDNVDKILEERGKRYNLNGTYFDFCVTSQKLKEAARAHKGYDNLPPDMRETIDMILHKVTRILNGDPYYRDNWDDICGYAKLVTNLKT